MSKKGPSPRGILVDHVVRTFVKPELVEGSEFRVQSIGDVLALPVTALNGIGVTDALVLEKVLGVKTVDDLASLDPMDPLAGARSGPETSADVFREFSPEFDLQEAISAARTIKHARKSEGAYASRKETKVVFLGLDNAGKTAILNLLGGKMGYRELKNLKPTKRIERTQIQTKDLSIFLWEFGGQEEFRAEYTKRPERYFMEIDMLVYVVDMQDPDRFNESFAYFSELLDLLDQLDESPYVLVFLHKSDPEYVVTPEYELHLEYVTERLSQIFHSRGLKYDTYQTSIYNFFSPEPKFSKFLKELLTSTSLSDPVLKKVTGLADVVDTTLHAIIRLSSSFTEQFNALSERVARIEAWIQQVVSQGLSAGTPQAPPQLPTAKPPSERDARATILSELKDLFRKRRALDEE
ncbi:MAG: hypothetical protein Kow0069_23060 [Promethearchaeota archaeon]